MPKKSLLISSESPSTQGLQQSQKNELLITNAYNLQYVNQTEKPVDIGVGEKKTSKELSTKVRLFSIPYNICEQIIDTRIKRDSYALFFKFKSLSTSGVLDKNFRLANECLLSWNCFNKLLKHLSDIGLITISNKRIHLLSWDKFKDQHKIRRLIFYKTEYEKKPGHKLIEYAIRDNYRHQNNEIIRYKRLYKQYAENSDTRAELEQYINEVITLSQSTIAKYLGAKLLKDKEGRFIKCYEGKYKSEGIYKNDEGKIMVGKDVYQYQNAQYYLKLFKAKGILKFVRHTKQLEFKGYSNVLQKKFFKGKNKPNVIVFLPKISANAA